MTFVILFTELKLTLSLINKKIYYLDILGGNLTELILSIFLIAGTLTISIFALITIVTAQKIEDLLQR